MKKSALGICIGASTISFVFTQKEDDNITISHIDSIAHEGNPKSVLTKYLFSSPVALENEIPVVVTGRKFKNLMNAKIIPEPEAIEKAIRFLKLEGKYNAVASLGGENFIVYCLSENGSIEKVLTGNKCASGTGEFFLQQIGRMNLSLKEAVEMSKRDSYYSVSGRCSVFCKSDCTHALNKGIEKGLVVRGLCKMIADKTIELLAKQNSGDILIIGGVSQNDSVVQFIKDKYPSTFIPDEASYFEALGASLTALSSYSSPDYIIDTNDLFKDKHHSFPVLEPLMNERSKVTFKELKRDKPLPGDECILGLDVGSTTTKAVLIRVRDNALLASVYLRTNGNPVQASIDCYSSLREQVDVPVKITGLGTTGSGRHIAALHALTKGIVNEIIAHAVAAAYFDKEVDTIFEIGGQDAKYTYLTNGIASDYAMNEACSAGTGSFLEESAKETLNIFYREIADIAFTAEHPLNFNDQCAAFISSDIKSASHEGSSREDIVAGLVYSICMNYVNRVKGNRPVGKKVFMQGGVCYNKAVPYAMSNLINKEIIVPPEPGLMGAFGVAIEIKNRIGLGFLEKSEFDLDHLITREFHYEKDFICAGGREKCDRKCGISVINVEGKKYPFGGACSKYYNERTEQKIDAAKHNYVKLRQDLVYKKYCVYPNGHGKTIGITRSFQVNTLYPLYYNFFAKLGFKVVLADKPDPAGLDKMASSFCYPVEIAHGLIQDLINKNVDYIFLPHVSQMDYDDGHKYKRLCVFVQSEPYYIRSAFENTKHPPFISPLIDMSLSAREVKKTFIAFARSLGCNSHDASLAFDFAEGQFSSMLAEFSEIGKNILKRIDESDDEFAMVIFGRSYNAFAGEANLNIPHKFASRNITIIPHDFLPSDGYESYNNMYWFSGQQILRSARLVKDNLKLFGVFITNFSCGPDSFILSYFRNVMGNKPSLTLELDSHSADVGVDTRIDAALDIIRNYNELKRQGLVKDKVKELSSLSVTSKDNKVLIVDNKGKEFRLNSPEVEVIIPSMGKFSTSAFSAICRSMGINSRPLPVPTSDTLKFGRGLTTCKECLPFILTTGSLVEFAELNKNEKKILFFMPHGYGPCRQGQYFILLRDIINDLKYDNIGVLSMDDEASFSDLGNDFFLKGWIAIVVADVIHDIDSVISTLAVDRKKAKDILSHEWSDIEKALENGELKALFDQLKHSAAALKNIKLKHPVEEAKVVSLVGEIYVRREEFSRQDLISNLVENGFVVRTAPIAEYLYYSNYLIKKGIVNGSSFKYKAGIAIKDVYQRYYERKIKKILSASGLINFEMVEIKQTVNYGKKMVSEKLVGETILTAGLAMREILDEACGIISIGPFNCMPSRLSEALLNREMTLEGKYRNGDIVSNGYPDDLTTLPFLYIESDGNPYPQITQSRLEIFMMQAEKVYEKIRKKKQQKA